MLAPWDYQLRVSGGWLFLADDVPVTEADIICQTDL